MLLKNKLEKAIIEEDIHSKVETNKEGDNCCKCEKKQRQGSDVIEMQKVAVRIELEKANTVIADLKFQVEESKEIVKCNILCKYEEEVISLRKELEEAKANEELARLKKHYEEEIAPLRSKEKSDVNIENLLS